MMIKSFDELQKLGWISRVGIVVILCIFMFGGILMVGGCQATEPDPEPDETEEVEPELVRKETVKIGMESIPPFQNPYRSISGVSFHLYFSVFDTCTVIDLDGNVQLNALESIENVDDVTWLLSLHEGIYFHDGTEMTAEDLAYTFEYALDPDNGLAVLARCGPVQAEVVDKYTVRVITESPDPLFDRRLILFPILPKEMLTALGPEDFWLAPIGSGPFKMIEYIADDSVLLERNDDYWGDLAETERIELINMRDPATRTSALRGGDVDVIRALVHDQIQLLEGDPNTRVEAFPVSYSTIFDINSLEGHPALKDVRVRQAINYAVDKEAILEGIFLGFGQVLDGQVGTNDAFGHNPNLEPYPYDPEKARSLIAEAGYDPDEIQLVLSYAEGYYPPGTSDVPEAIAFYLGEVGIIVEINPLEYGRYIEFFYGEQEGDLFGWPPRSVAGDLEFIYPFFTADSRKPSWYNPRFDQVFAASRKEMDVERRKELLHEAAAISHEEASHLFLIHPDSLYGVSEGVRGLEANPHDFIHLDRIYVLE